MYKENMGRDLTKHPYPSVCWQNRPYNYSTLGQVMLYLSGTYKPSKSPYITELLSIKPD